jgi:hypothetical protein
MCGGAPLLTKRNRLAETEAVANDRRLLVLNTDQARARAEASFKKQERAREGAEAWKEHEAETRATREKTARLRALRLAREAADKAAVSERKPS